MNVWDFVNDIMLNKKNLISEGDLEYNPFIVNKALSLYRDCIFYAAEMDRMNFLNKKMQHDFYFYVIPSKKRQFQKWPKMEIDSKIELIRQVYNCSTKKAIEILSLLDDNKIDFLKQKIDKGGIE